MSSENSSHPQPTKESTLVRDSLAIDRTALANERTLLAYLRTALAFLITGAAAIRFFTEPVLTAIGWFFIALGPLMLAIGLVRFAVMKDHINEYKDRTENARQDTDGPASL